MKNKVIIISPHPDDETLGAGGTLHKHKNNGDEIYWLIITDIESSPYFTNEQKNYRKEEIELISKLYSFDKVFNLNYIPSSLTQNNLSNLIEKISKIFLEIKPNILYLPNRSDVHSDHRIIFDATFSCTKSFRYPFIKMILMYECLSETEFSPALPENSFIANYFIDISEFIDKKISAMKIYKSEIDNHPFPRSIENIISLAKYRGASCGVKYAEAFHLLKFIDK